MKSPNELSFLPDDYLVRKARRRANLLCAGLSVVVMGAIAAGFMLSERSVKALEKRHAEVDRRYTDAAKRIDLVTQMRGQQEKIVYRAELASSLVEKVPRSNLLAELTNSLPAGVSLLELTMESKIRTEKAKDEAPKSAFEAKKAKIEAARKAKAKSQAKGKGGKGGAADDAVEDEKPREKAKVYDVTLKITGVADTDVQVAQFMRRLGDSRLLKDVNLLVTDVHAQGDVTMRKFQIEMMLNPRAEVRADEMPANQTAAAELGDAAPAGK